MKRFTSTTVIAATRNCSYKYRNFNRFVTQNGLSSLSKSPRKIRVESFSSLTPRGSTSVSHRSKDGVVGIPIDFDVQSRIEGNESQIVMVTLQPGQVLRAESGAMMYMTEGVEMNTTTG